MKAYKLNQIENKRILGRNVKNAGNSDKPLNLFWAAAALELNVKSSEVWINISSKYNTYEPWISVYINNSPVCRFMAPVEPQWICIARNMNPENQNLITIYKDNQPMSGEELHSLFIHEIGLSDTGTFEPLKPRKMSIEFVGDSITSGEGLAGCLSEGDWISQWMCASKNYAVQLCKKLDADWSLVSQCGWGICWGWDGNRNSVMPPHYKNVCSVMWGDFQNSLGVNEPYDFSVKNDYVIVNLGTNDNGAFAQPAWKDSDGKEYVLTLDENKKASKKDGTVVAEGVKDFLKTIREKNPDSKIIWVWGMIKLTMLPDFILQGIEDYKKLTGDKKVYSLELDAMEDVEVCDEDKGSRGHPGPKTHKLAAEKIYNFIQNLQAEE